VHFVGLYLQCLPSPNRSARFRRTFNVLFIVYVRRLRVFDNRVLKRIFGPNRNKVTGEWRKPHEELNGPYCSPSIIRVIKLRRMRWAGHVKIW